MSSFYPSVAADDRPTGRLPSTYEAVLENGDRRYRTLAKSGAAVGFFAILSLVSAGFLPDFWWVQLGGAIGAVTLVWIGLTNRARRLAESWIHPYIDRHPAPDDRYAVPYPAPPSCEWCLVWSLRGVRMTREGPAEDWLRNTAWHLAQGRFADPESVFLSLVMTTPVEEFRIEREVFLAEPAGWTSVYRSDGASKALQEAAARDRRNQILTMATTTH